MTTGAMNEPAHWVKFVRRDVLWLVCLFGAALVGTALARLVHARAAYRRLTTQPGPGATAPGDR